jgi:hypothetical protein
MDVSLEGRHRWATRAAWIAALATAAGLAVGGANVLNAQGLNDEPAGAWVVAGFFFIVAGGTSSCCRPRSQGGGPSGECDAAQKRATRFVGVEADTCTDVFRPNPQRTSVQGELASE